jgi:ABC-type multidrug transport system fused ATPase/permease subunit
VPLLSGDAAERQNGTTTAAEPSDKDYTNTVHELAHLAKPDSTLLATAFACGMLAAVGQALIPYYTGKGVDAASSIADVSEFHTIIRNLLLTAAGTAIVAAARGGLFTLICARLNKRLRERLFSHLLDQVCPLQLSVVHFAGQVLCFSAHSGSCC